ncbi:cation transporting ATPase C-terminal domain-containing protein [Streptomyces xiangluensis]|uniref:Cation transporting ATPase C-terminal domain-containing protein n=1 Tax=Streptomyces xiangluensis TaxID=2665720 RepID=A0ABV8YHX8_9ACTN
MPLPLLPAQILWINLLTHGLPVVALGAEPVDPHPMRNSPQPPEESVLGAGLLPRILFMGAFVATVPLVVGVLARETGRPWQSMIFLVRGTDPARRGPRFPGSPGQPGQPIPAGRRGGHRAFRPPVSICRPCGTCWVGSRFGPPIWRSPLCCPASGMSSCVSRRG